MFACWQAYLRVVGGEIALSEVIFLGATRSMLSLTLLESTSLKFTDFFCCTLKSIILSQVSALVIGFLPSTFLLSSAAADKTVTSLRRFASSAGD